MAVTVLLDDGTSSDNGVVSVMTPVNQPQRSVGAHVALQLSSTTSAGLGLGVSALMESAAGTRREQRRNGSVCLSLKAAADRIASRVLVAVSASVLVWHFPARATALIATLTVVASASELSWLAARVTSRLVAAFYTCEAVREQLNARRAADTALDGSKMGSNIEEALLNIRAGVDGAITTPMLAERESEADSNATSQINAQLQRHEASPSSSPVELESLISPVANKLFCGKQWLAAAVLALPLAGLLVLVEVTAVREWKVVPSSGVLALDSDADADDFAWSITYLVITRLVASVCSLLAPSALTGLLLLVELELFSVLSMSALSCRAGVTLCSSSSPSGFLPVFVVGVGALLCANAIGNEEPVAIAVSPALSASIFLWVHCLGVVAMSLIPSNTDESSGSDASDVVETARNLLVAVIASVSAADVGSQLWQTTIARWWDQSTPIQRRLSVSVDVESALVGASCGILVAVAMTQLLPLPNGGPVLDYALLTLAAVAAARAAELLLVLLKHAAGGGRSPVMDHSAGLLAGALVFAQYARAL